MAPVHQALTPEVATRFGAAHREARIGPFTGLETADSRHSKQDRISTGDLWLHQGTKFTSDRASRFENDREHGQMFVAQRTHGPLR